MLAPCGISKGFGDIDAGCGSGDEVDVLGIGEVGFESDSRYARVFL